MLTSMLTAINSLSIHQFYLDVISDNLANANTIGFKSSRVTFQTQFAQLFQPGQVPAAATGGINPIQVGLGVTLGSVTADFSQGMLQSTGFNTDVAIMGDGFFVFSDGSRNTYSRDGGMQIDANGMLVSAATGLRVQGWLADGAGVVDTGLPPTEIPLPIDSTLAKDTENVSLGGNLDATMAPGDTYDVTVGVYDSLGVLHTITVTFTKDLVLDNSYDWEAFEGVASLDTGTVTFDGDGQYLASSGSVTVPGVGGATDTVFDLDLSAMSQLADISELSTSFQDGYAAGALSTFYITPGSGEVFAVYTNGLESKVGQLAIASFVNPTGLIRTGQNQFVEGPNAGIPDIGAPGTGQRGTVISGYLEGSNVDLAQEFTNMILAQRGFQASSRVITTSDEILQELVNLKR